MIYIIKTNNLLSEFLVSLLHCSGYSSHIVWIFMGVRYVGIIIITILNDFALHGEKLLEDYGKYRLERTML